MGSVRPKSPSRASSRSFCTACGSTEPSSTGRRRRLPRNEHNEITGFPQNGGEKSPLPGEGGGGIAPFFLGSPSKRTRLQPLFPPRVFTPPAEGRPPPPREKEAPRGRCPRG